MRREVNKVHRRESVLVNILLRNKNITKLKTIIEQVCSGFIINARVYRKKYYFFLPLFALQIKKEKDRGDWLGGDKISQSWDRTPTNSGCMLHIQTNLTDRDRYINISSFVEVSNCSIYQIKLTTKKDWWLFPTVRLFQGNRLCPIENRWAPIIHSLTRRIFLL